MNDDQITALAREYAAETVSHTRLSTTIADDAEDVIRFLLRRYCLVEKKRVIAELKAVDLSIKASLTFILKVDEVEMGKKKLLHSLFPEIAKEVEQ